MTARGIAPAWSAAAVSHGCDTCSGADHAATWTASRATHLRVLDQESHFSVQLTACTCGQRFVTVFTERVDRAGGEDALDWLALPVSQAEAARLEAGPPDELPGLVTALGRDRRFLVRSFPSGGALGTSWRDSGFAIGPHD